MNVNVCIVRLIIQWNRTCDEEIEPEDVTYDILINSEDNLTLFESEMELYDEIDDICVSDN